MLDRPRLNRDTLVILVAWLLAFAFVLTPFAPPAMPWPLTLLEREIFDNAHRDWYWLSSLLPVGFVAWASARRRGERDLIALASLAMLASSFAFTLLVTGSAIGALYAALKYTALLGLGVLAWQARRPGGLDHLLVAVMLSTYLALRLAYLPLTCLLRGDTLDLFTYAFDEAAGFNPALWSFGVYHARPLLGAVLHAGYMLIMVLPLSLYALQIYRPDPRVAPSLRVFVATGALGFVVYLVFPVSGPLYFFGESYGHHVAALHTDLRSLAFRPTWRNGVPSLHFSTALLMFLNVPRGVKAIKALFFAFFLVTVFAAMGNGEHYFFDLVCALPFVAGVNAFCRWLNPGGGRPHLYACLRALAAFAGLLALLVIAPAWLFTRTGIWTLVALVCAHFAYETARVTRTMAERARDAGAAPSVGMAIPQPLPANG